MLWQLSNRCDPQARELADRHYNRQTIGALNFVPPGRCLVLYAEENDARAFWVTSYPEAEYVLHEWAGAMICSAFRNEGFPRASHLILQALAVTRARWPALPEQGLITFVDPKHVKPTKVRGKEVYGFCFLKAGFDFVGYSKTNRLHCFHMPRDRWPPPEHPLYTDKHPRQGNKFIA